MFALTQPVTTQPNNLIMARSGTGVDVCMESLVSGGSPSCLHGPTLLFEKIIKTKNGVSSIERFYACSACRDRKDCNFFQRLGENVSKEVMERRHKKNQQIQQALSQTATFARLQAFRKQPQTLRSMCRDCGLLLLEDDLQEHRGHELISQISDEQLTTPTSLLMPLDSNKKNAQYLFHEKVVSFMLTVFADLNIKQTLCIGAPRIHEEVMKVNQIQSLLLDMDHRLGQFYSEKEFCRYNMFNHHFFDGEESRETFSSFLKHRRETKDRVAVVMDPPFGGLVDVLSFNLKKIMQLWKSSQNAQKPVVFWFFPYFLEPRIISAFSDFTMLDYKVDYDNHAVFTSGEKTNKKGSPVRIFTNAAPSTIRLPADEGYRFCEKCERYVSRENLHCSKCNACTSKDGRQYVHCDKCDRCVKPSWKHCDTCCTCLLPDHTCGQAVSQGCHICGELGHKRRECPKRNNHNKDTCSSSKTQFVGKRTGKKRKIHSQMIKPKKKRE